MLPGELNVRESHGNVVAFTPNTGGGAIETMTVDTQDLLDHLADVDVDTLAKLVGKTIELTKGPGTDVILDATRPRDLYDRFWLIKQIIDIGGGRRSSSCRTRRWSIRASPTSRRRRPRPSTRSRR